MIAKLPRQTAEKSSDSSTPAGSSIIQMFSLREFAWPASAA